MPAAFQGTVLALAGGVGGAKLVWGLAQVLEPEQLTVAVNTGDDDCFHGLHISPDLDTMLYTLAGLSNRQTGWGIAGDTFHGLAMLGRYGAETWFNLGDRDLATHIRRTQLLREGATLSEVTAELSRCLGVRQRIVPMSDDPVRTFLTTADGELTMQEYFVRERSQPAVSRVQYRGAESARLSPGFAAALATVEVVILCPSNSLLSLEPMLAVPGARESLTAASGKRWRAAVSPMVGGAAVSGPAARLMDGLGYAATALGVARLYRGLCDFFLMDERDAALAPAVEELGMRAVSAPIIMETDGDKIALAELILKLGKPGGGNELG